MEWQRPIRSIMMRVTVVAGLAGLGSGCCLHQPYLASGGCDSCHPSLAAHGPALAGDCGGCGDCGSCGDVYPGTCGECASGHCGGLGGLVLPLLSTRLACGSGCGGVYFGEWLYDPPDCCDPCNDCGCFVDAQPCHHRCGILDGVAGVLHSVKQVVVTGIYGYYPCGGCGHCGGCDTVAAPCHDCGAGDCGGNCDGGLVSHAAPIEPQTTGPLFGSGLSHKLTSRRTPPPPQQRPHHLVSRRMPR